MFWQNRWSLCLILCLLTLRPKLDEMLFVRGKISAIYLGRLHTGMPKALLQIIDRPAGFQPVNGVSVSQIVEPEAAERLRLFTTRLCRFLCLGLQPVHEPLELP